MQQAYYQRSPYNLVRIILGLPELFDAERGESVYTRAARDFKAWREQGVLLQEKTPCVFAYAQRFQVPGSSEVKERRGFIALGKLHDYAEQVVFRHEYTLSKPKSDRLNLLKATHAHFGQIFMLYSDPAGSVEKILYDGNGAADAEVTDEYGVLHRLWRVNDPAAIRLLAAAMADKKLIIADGHHRYETALNYSKEHAAAAPAKNEHSTNQLPAARLSRSRSDDDVRQYGFGRPGDSADASRGARVWRGSMRRHFCGLRKSFSPLKHLLAADARDLDRHAEGAEGHGVCCGDKGGGLSAAGQS